MAISSPIARLTDIIEAVELIRSEMAGMTLQTLEPDKRKRWLVERGIEIVSEASRRGSSTAAKGQRPGPENNGWVGRAAGGRGVGGITSSTEGGV